MHLGQVAIALSLALGTAQADYVSMYYYKKPNCGGNRHHLEVNGDGCNKGDRKISSFRLTHYVGRGQVSFYQDGAACVGQSAYTEQDYRINVGKCHNMRHGEGGSVQ